MSTSTSSFAYHGTASQRSQEELNSDHSEMPFHITERERRYTTITLREIRYPCGCPCHPANPEAAKKQKQRAQSPDARPSAFVYHSRPELTPRSESQDSTNSTDSTNSQTRRAFGNFFFRRTSS